MSFISRIKKKFKKQTTSIVLYDLNDVILLDPETLSEPYKSLAISKIEEYYRSININNLKGLIEYNEDAYLQGAKLADLLISYSIELNEVIRLDNKTPQELERLTIDLNIKNIKILVIKEMLEELKFHSELRTLALKRYKEEFEKKILDFWK